MLDKKELENLSKLANIDQTTVMREYLQLLFLSNFYQNNEARKIFFKGGTAIRLIFKGDRFSEDLDFTVNLSEKDFDSFFKKISKELKTNYPFEFKEKDTLEGRKILLTAKPPIINFDIFVNLDFSFREKVQEPEKSVIKTHFPVIFREYIHHLSKDEILAEKIRAIYSRKKGRDLYDLWFLLNRGAVVKPELINKKLNYNNGHSFIKSEFLKEVRKIKKKDFITDLKPFVIDKERDQLEQRYDYLIDYIKEELN